MAKKKLFGGIMKGARDALAIARGEADPASYRIHVPKKVNVRAIRRKLGLSQAEFSLQYSIKLDRLQDWEQKRSNPDAAMRAYLLVIDRRPDAVKEALEAA